MTAHPTDKAETLAWLRRISGDLATATIQRLEQSLPWYSEMPPARRSAVGLVAQAGITSFIQWYDDPQSTPWIAADIFAAAPRELLRSVSLQQTLQLIRVSVTVTEERIASKSESLREAILLYSREVAFAAADVYARAAEARGLWDARLEALVVDSILTGETDEELPSRIAALGWHGHGEVAVLVGTTPPQFDVDQLRRTARKLGVDVLIGVQGSRLVLVIGRSEPSPRAEDAEQDLPFPEIARRLEPGFGPGYLVLGPAVPALVDASMSARAALAGFAVARAWRHAPRPVEADDLLPERALAGDPLAKQTLIERIYRPLHAHSTDLVTTLWSYLDNGRSLEATARELFVHPNTVRYRLKRVSEVIGWDATGPREALILQTALILGSIGTESVRRRPAALHRRVSA
ncbi:MULTISPECIES: CdaR family transcriptional regulator [Microbacterium]|uniref:PucR family transcriptional regulator n=1 Tax=Microbacterium TaxID=33882 RepID=UPI000C5DDBEC|nr:MULTISPECIES: PucR family transcriptional regulator [Microbacterium]MEC8761697.1 helix-turn-helix domain-containing protein [Actinomycetota bacterium]MBU19602.1 PucR family transcriptional regulator [Microbacterium sp.]MCC4268383.1 helix-turn-helix domain-containing protein [Microbacterium schleiferi]HAJ17331.1 PucR family transcriptional regulator [Microbacterium sp.]HAM12614.1 PucR family transcriptional regulator [Microbacterium sp.]|tara:strand:+ start:3769 stop:4986 length:1218 start_codon:yes stop_codon:yes gene_type:complete